ncbi:MAG: hypothetical protein LBD23_05120 [Oscillospiraceae bacterium]|nr:hypothetical protein [Oscillospiraceae bacterium]
MRELLEGVDKEELLDFLDNYAKDDSKFANTVNVRFGNPGYYEELKKIKKAIDAALEGVKDDNTRDSWGNVNFCTGDILSEISMRIEQGHIKLAFAETVLLYRELLNLFEYQGECEISMEAEYCIGIMSDIADAAVIDEDKAYIFGHCIMLSNIIDGKDYGADYEDELLKVSVKLVTAENRSELEEALSRVDVRRFDESIRLIQLDIIRKFDGASVADAFINENLRFPKMRELAFESAMTRNDFAEGERLCIEGIAAIERNYGISPWLYRLFSVHEKAGNIDSQIETAKEIVLLGSMEYYDILKSLLIEQRSWDSGYRNFLRECEEKMHSSSYMSVLAKENELKLLLKETIKHTRQIYDYGKLLAREYPTEVLAIIQKQINKEAKAATKRSRYKDVCDSITAFAKMGYHIEAISLVDNLKNAYRHRPAFVDELNHLNTYLQNRPDIMYMP